MTTHQLATLLDHLRDGFADNLKAGASNEFSEAAAAFRQIPDASLKDFVKSLRQAASPSRAAKGSSAVDLSGLIVRIRAVRESQAGAEPTIDLDALKLNNAQLKEILKAFGEKPTNTVAGNLTKVRQLLHAVGASGAPTPSSDGTSADSAAIEEGVRLFNALLADRKLSIPDVRAGFEPLRAYSKGVLEEVSRRVGYTPVGSHIDILNRLLTNLEGIKLSQHRADRIMVGTGT